MNHLKWDLYLRTIESKTFIERNKWMINWFFLWKRNEKYDDDEEELFAVDLKIDSPSKYSLHKWEDTNHHLIKCYLMHVHEWIPMFFM